MNITLMNSPGTSDEQLWHLACEGDREAFGRIVERYQALVCSLAYSACGTLGTSEDMAQETFITAWHRLKELRDPGKLRPWLCGIVRNLAANAVRRELRRGGEPESLDTVGGELSFEGDPASQTITSEEETLLWRTLAEMPANYREPLILFYREEQSVTEVAAKLDLTEDTVKQRLSRGRAMLREEMATLVESTLTRTPPTASAAATGAVAAKAAATAGKSALGSVGLGAIAGPLIGLLIGLFGSKAVALTARSPEERKCIKRYAWGMVVFCFAMSVGLAVTLSQAGKLYPVSPGWLIFGVCAWVATLVVTIHFWAARMQREVVRIRAKTGTEDNT
jgi:RNA polymerase sigma factor (sigma-70 family)